jgi:hypothetical protein
MTGSVLVAQIVICGASLVLFWRACEPEEIRHYRKWRLPAVMVLTWVLVRLWSPARPQMSMIPGLLIFVGVGSLWGPVVTHWTAGGVIRFLFGGGGGRFRTDFNFARARAAEGDVEGTVAALHEELEKDPLNYEGLMLLASAYQHLKRPDDALIQIDRILCNPEAGLDQKKIALAAREETLQLRLHLQALAGGPVPSVPKSPPASRPISNHS